MCVHHPHQKRTKMGDHHQDPQLSKTEKTKKKRKRSSKSTTSTTAKANNLLVDDSNINVKESEDNESHRNKSIDDKDVQSDQPRDANVVEANVLKENGIQHDPPTNDDDDDGDGDGDDNGEANKAKRKRKRKRKAKKDEEDNTSPPDDAEQQKMTSLDHTVYVEGIPFDCTEDDVKQWFVSHNCADILQMRLSRWQDTGRLRGYGHVVFDSQESRTRALQELNGKSLGKRYLTIVAPNAPKANTSGSMMMSSPNGSTPRVQPEGCKVVFVKNLPYHATEDDILESFQVCGKILDGGIRIARNSATRQSKGFAYVEYKNPEGAQGAVQKASKPFGLKVLDRPVFVDYDEGRMKGSYKTEDGRLWSKEFGKKNAKTKH